MNFETMFQGALNLEKEGLIETAIKKFLELVDFIAENKKISIAPYLETASWIQKPTFTQLKALQENCSPIPNCSEILTKAWCKIGELKEESLFFIAAILASPELPYGYIEFAKTLNPKTEKKELKQFWAKAFKHCPDEKNLLLEIAKGLACTHAHALALEAVSLAEEAGLARKDFLYLRAVSHMGLRRYENWLQAKEDLLEYIEIKGENKRSLSNLALCLFYLRETKEAVAVNAKSLLLDPDDDFSKSVQIIIGTKFPIYKKI